MALFNTKRSRLAALASDPIVKPARGRYDSHFEGSIPEYPEVLDDSVRRAGIDPSTLDRRDLLGRLITAAWAQLQNWANSSQADPRWEEIDVVLQRPDCTNALLTNYLLSCESAKAVVLHNKFAELLRGQLPEVMANYIREHSAGAQGQSASPAAGAHTADEARVTLAPVGGFHSHTPAHPKPAPAYAPQIPPRSPGPASASSPGRSHRQNPVVATAILAGVVIVVGFLISLPTKSDRTATALHSARDAATSTFAEAAPVPDAVEPKHFADADAYGFEVFGNGARCFNSDPAVMFMRTNESALVVCRSEVNRLYYRGYRIADGAKIDLYDVSPQSGGYVAINSPDNARYEIASTGFQLIQNGDVVVSEAAVEIGP